MSLLPVLSAVESVGNSKVSTTFSDFPPFFGRFLKCNPYYSRDHTSTARLSHLVGPRCSNRYRSRCGVLWRASTPPLSSRDLASSTSSPQRLQFPDSERELDGLEYSWRRVPDDLSSCTDVRPPRLIRRWACLPTHRAIPLLLECAPVLTRTNPSSASNTFSIAIAIITLC